MAQAMRLVLSIVVALATAFQVHAQSPGPSTIVVERPWARATPGGAKTGSAVGRRHAGGGQGAVSQHH
jgi:copper(I)-binding protein